MCIGPDFKADKFDQESLLNFVEEGNTAFIAAETFPPAFLDALRVRTHTSLIGSDSLIHFVNPELGSRKYVLPLRSLSTWFSAIDSSSEDSPEKMTNALATADSSATFGRSEEHTSELQSLMRTSYAVFCLKKKKYENTL